MFTAPFKTSTSRALQRAAGRQAAGPRLLPVSLLCLLAVALVAGGAPVVHAQPMVLFVNTTADPAETTGECKTDDVACSLRGAVTEAAASTTGAIIRACFDPAEIPDAVECPPGKQPLKISGGGYEPSTGKFVIRLVNQSIKLAANGTIIDFRQGVRPWEGPQDNRIVIDSTNPEVMKSGFQIFSENNVIAGVEFRGAYETAAVYLPGGVFGEAAAHNQIGPGNIFAGLTSGIGVYLSGEAVYENRVFGNWCGITGDGTVPSPILNDCVKVDQGAYSNVIGDLVLENRNIFAMSELGSGVIVEGPDAYDNVVQGNWFGMDVTGGTRLGLQSGINLIADPKDTVIEKNVISGNESAGISLFDEIENTVIQENIIGGDPSGEACVGNVGAGISLTGGPRLTLIRRNNIRCNVAGGVVMAGMETVQNQVTENVFRDNGGRPIRIVQRANGEIVPPALTAATTTSVSGTACAGCEVEIFSVNPADPQDEASAFEGRVTAGGDGAFTFSKPSGFASSALVASQMDDLNSSELSARILVDGSGPDPTPTTPGPTPSPSPTGPTSRTATPTPTSETTPGAAKIYLPFVRR